MKFVSKSRLRVLLEASQDTNLIYAAKNSKLDQQLKNCREAHAETLAVLRRVRAERDDLLRPIEQARNPLLIVAASTPLGNNVARDLGLTPDRYRIITSPEQLRGYHNRRYIKAWYPSSGNPKWEAILNELEMLKSVGGFVEITGT